MTMAEWFCEYEANRPRGDTDFAGTLTQGDVDRLWALIEDDD